MLPSTFGLFALWIPPWHPRPHSSHLTPVAVGNMFSYSPFSKNQWLKLKGQSLRKVRSSQEAHQPNFYLLYPQGLAILPPVEVGTEASSHGKSSSRSAYITVSTDSQGRAFDFLYTRGTVPISYCVYFSIGEGDQILGEIAGDEIAVMVLSIILLCKWVSNWKAP